MGLELPMASAIMARLAEPEINLAAYGGIVFALALFIEAPVIMLLAASTALSRDWHSYVALRRFTLVLGGSLMGLHALIAFTPLYDLIVNEIIRAPADIVEPARLGLRLVTPWTFMIAIRRFQQGVLIRAGRSRSVGLGTLVRLVTNAGILTTGALTTSLPGAALAASGAAAGVIAEALVVKIRVQPVLAEMRRRAEAGLDTPGLVLSVRELIAFYTPLAMTPVMTLISLPIVSASLSRMPLAIESLAVWPVLNGFLFAMRSLGIAFNEVVIARMDEPGSMDVLRRFAALLAVATGGLLVVVVTTPLAGVWFGGVAGLAPDLARMGTTALWIAIAFPVVSVYQSFNQARIVNSRRTRGVTEAVVLQLAVNTAILLAGITYGQITGLYVGVLASFTGNLAQLGWLYSRARRLVAPTA
jgi:hypothetical protein